MSINTKSLTMSSGQLLINRIKRVIPKSFAAFYYRGYCMNQPVCYLILTHVLHNVKLNKRNKKIYVTIPSFLVFLIHILITSPFTVVNLSYLD